MHTRLTLHAVNCERLLKEYIERRIHFTLSRFADRIDTLTVRISCSPGGPDEVTCLVTANVRPFGTITAKAVDHDAYSAIDACAARFFRQCHSALTRFRDGRSSRTSIRVPDLRSAA